MKANVTGSGLVGLIAVVLIAKESIEVKRFEQQEKICGITSTTEKDD